MVCNSYSEIHTNKKKEPEAEWASGSFLCSSGLRLCISLVDLVAALFQKAVNPVGWIQQLADGHVVIQCINDIGDVLRHINFRIPFTL